MAEAGLLLHHEPRPGQRHGDEINAQRDESSENQLVSSDCGGLLGHHETLAHRLAVVVLSGLQHIACAIGLARIRLRLRTA